MRMIRFASEAGSLLMLHSICSDDDTITVYWMQPRVLFA